MDEIRIEVGHVAADGAASGQVVSYLQQIVGTELKAEGLRRLREAAEIVRRTTFFTGDQMDTLNRAVANIRARAAEVAKEG